MEKQKIKENPMTNYKKTNRNFLGTDKDYQEDRQELKDKLPPDHVTVNKGWDAKNKPQNKA